MKRDIERNLGQQPITMIMEENELKPHDIVTASEEQMTHKMISRACKGRKLTANTKTKVRDALNKALGTDYSMSDLFNY